MKVILYRDEFGKIRQPTMAERWSWLERMTRERQLQLERNSMLPPLPPVEDPDLNRSKQSKRRRHHLPLILRLVHRVLFPLRRPPRWCPACGLVMNRCERGFSGYEFVWICPGCRKSIEED